MEDSLLDLSFLDEEMPGLEEVEQEQKPVTEPIKRTTSKQRIGDDEEEDGEPVHTNGNGTSKKRKRMKRRQSDSDQDDIEKVLNSELEEEDEYFGHEPGSKSFMETCAAKVVEILQQEKDLINNKKRAKKRVISDEEESVPIRPAIEKQEIPIATPEGQYPFAALFDHLDNEVMKSSKFVMPRKYVGDKELRTRLSKNRILVNPNAIVLLVKDIEEELHHIQPRLRAENKGNIMKMCDSITASVAGSRDQNKLNFAYKYLTEMLESVRNHNSNN